MNSPDKPVSLKSEEEAERLHVQPPKRPLLNFIRSIIQMSTKGSILPDKIHLNNKLYEQFFRDFCDASGAVHQTGEHAGIAVFCGVPVYQHSGSAPIILFLPDYGGFK